MTVQDDAYRDIARWYDIEHDPIADDVECYQELLNADVGPQATILELGSGTGRTAAALAAAGFAVTGVEPSSAMRERCAKRLATLPERVSRRVRTVDGTATSLNLDVTARYDAALFGLNTLAHLTSVAERHEALTAIREHLKPDGILILDVDMAGPRKMAESVGRLWLQGMWPIADSAETLMHLVAAQPSERADILRLTHLYDVMQQDGAVRRTVATMDLAMLTAAEIELALLHAGYQLSERYGGYDLGAFDGESLRLLVVARKSA